MYIQSTQTDIYIYIYIYILVMCDIDDMNIYRDISACDI